MKSIKIKSANTKSEIEECFRLREEVFIIEQSVPVDLERDEHDATALHFLALVDAKPVGTARVVLKDNGTVAKIQRPNIVEPKDVIGVTMRHHHRVKVLESVTQGLLAKVRRSIDDYGLARMLD